MSNDVSDYAALVSRLSLMTEQEAKDEYFYPSKLESRFDVSYAVAVRYVQDYFLTKKELPDVAILFARVSINGRKEQLAFKKSLFPEFEANLPEGAKLKHRQALYVESEEPNIDTEVVRGLIRPVGSSTDYLGAKDINKIFKLDDENKAAEYIELYFITSVREKVREVRSNEDMASRLGVLRKNSEGELLVSSSWMSDFCRITKLKYDLFRASKSEDFSGKEGGERPGASRRKFN